MSKLKKIVVLLILIIAVSIYFYCHSEYHETLRNIGILLLILLIIIGMIKCLALRSESKRAESTLKFKQEAKEELEKLKRKIEEIKK